MSPADKGIEDFDIRAARLFEEETAIRLEHPLDFIYYRFAPVWNVMQNAKDDDHILAGIGELAQVFCILNEELK